MRHFGRVRNDVEFVTREIWHFFGSLYPSGCQERQSMVARSLSSGLEWRPTARRFHRP